MSVLTHVMTRVKRDSMLQDEELRENRSMKSLREMKICSCGKCHLVLNDSARDWLEMDLVIFECTDCGSTLFVKTDNLVENVC